MEQIVRKAYAKINWSLLITGKRENGYHELDMLMQEIDLHDELRFQKSEKTELFINGELSGDESNLILKAVRALSKYTGKELSARIELQKRIPSRAGLGGGSSDCAQTMFALNELFGLNLTIPVMKEIAVRLGADVPYFLHGGLCRVRGIGEKVDEVSAAPVYHAVIKHVGEGLSTPEVYRVCDEVGYEDAAGNTENTLLGILTGNLPLVKESSANALEKAAFTLDKRIPDMIGRMYASGALYARMSGSGSAVYGIFADEMSARTAAAEIPGSIVTFTRA